MHGWPEAMLTAVHESGHATISRVFGLWGGAAQIYDTPNGVAGFAQSDFIEHLHRVWDKPRTPTAAIHCKIIIWASGAAAEREVCGVSREAEGDDEKIAWLLAFLPERSRREDRFRRFAGQLVRRHKRAIIRVASDLAIARQLRGSHIDLVVREETLGAPTSVLASRESGGLPDLGGNRPP
jgi:hypothetical protein